MKCVLCIASAIVGLIAVIFVAAAHFTPKDITVNNDGFCVLDFSMRMNEIDCVYAGLNPYNVWDGSVLHEKYYPYTKPQMRNENRRRPINAYTPWEYTYMYPLSLFDGYLMRWRAYYMLIVIALVFIGCAAYRYGMGAEKKWSSGALCFASICLLAPAMKEDLFVGNFAILCAALVIAMAMCLNKGCSGWAGFFWALLMTKPQMGVLFGIPLFFAKQYKVIWVAIAVCVVASIPPSLACRTWPWELVLQAPQASVHAFSYCALLPTALSSLLARGFGLSTEQILIFPAVIGVVLCAWISFRLRSVSDWFVRFSPCAILSISWTYNQSHSNCLSAIAIIVAARELIKKKGIAEVLFYGVSIVLFAKGGVLLGVIVENIVMRIGVPFGALISDIIRQTCSALSILAIMAICIRKQCECSLEIFEDAPMANRIVR